MGWGYCPTNIPQWNQKYKVAYALLQDGEVKAVLLDEKSNLSLWENGHFSTSKVTLCSKELKKGVYQWAVALVDVTKENRPALEIAVDKSLLHNGWLILNNVSIH